MNHNMLINELDKLIPDKQLVNLTENSINAPMCMVKFIVTVKKVL